MVSIFPQRLKGLVSEDSFDGFFRASDINCNLEVTTFSSLSERILLASKRK